eukprot:XP_017174888.1 PREDICTED: uncharacterized protein Gm40011 isoform X3 [Mus musculus]
MLKIISQVTLWKVTRAPSEHQCPHVQSAQGNSAGRERSLSAGPEWVPEEPRDGRRGHSVSPWAPQITAPPTGSTSKSQRHLQAPLPNHSATYRLHFQTTAPPTGSTSKPQRHLQVPLPNHSATYRLHFFMSSLLSSLCLGAAGRLQQGPRPGEHCLASAQLQFETSALLAVRAWNAFFA